MSKVSEKQYIKDLEHDMDMLSTMYLDMKKEKEELEKKLETLVLRVPSYYLIDKEKETGDHLRQMDYNDEKIYIYESTDSGKTLYRREFGDFNSPREEVDKDGNPLPTQMELF